MTFSGKMEIHYLNIVLNHNFKFKQNMHYNNNYAVHEFFTYSGSENNIFRYILLFTSIFKRQNILRKKATESAYDY
jgi:hypothetical protein